MLPEVSFRTFPVAMWRRMLTRPLESSHPLDLFRNTRKRKVQLYLAAVMIEKPSRLPAYLLHRARRDRIEGAGIVEREIAVETRGEKHSEEDAT
jgi:hypothetical protein